MGCDWNVVGIGKRSDPVALGVNIRYLQYNFGDITTSAIGIDFGVMGYLLRRFGYPLVPVLLGLLLGPMLESNFRRSLIVSEQGPLIFITSPVSAVLLLAAACLLLYFGFLQPRRQRGNESNQKI